MHEPTNTPADQSGLEEAEVPLDEVLPSIPEELTLENFEPIIVSASEFNTTSDEGSYDNIPIILQSQTDIEIEEVASDCDFDDTSIGGTTNDLNILSHNINNTLDDTDDYLAAELLAIESHRVSNKLVELEVS